MLLTIPFLLLTQLPCDVILADSVGDQLARLADLDGNQRIQSLNEASSLWRESGNRTPRALSVRVGNGSPVVYWVDSALDRIHSGTDVNGNGRIEVFERVVVRNSGALDGASTARGLALTTDGAIWWCSDAGLRGLFRMRDLDGSGAAEGSLEFDVLVDGIATGHPIETSLGTRFMDTRNLTEVEASGQMLIAYGDGPDEAIFAFRELNGDRDLMDAGESRLFLNATGKNPSLPQNEDWSALKLRSLTIPAPNGGRFYARLALFAVDSDGPRDIWYFGSDSALGGPYDTNQFGQGLNGLIFRGVDLNRDGDLQDAGELRPFYDGSHSSYRPQLEQILAMDCCGGALYIAHLTAGERRVARCFDANGNGSGEDAGEMEVLWFESSNWTGRVPFEQGNPLIRDLAAIPASAYAPPNTLFESLGPGCEYTQSGEVPTLHAIGRAFVGSSDFTIELRGAASGAYCFLFAGDDYPAWFTLALPADLGFIGLPGCKRYLGARWVKRFITTGTAGNPVNGFASHRFNLPPNPILAGGKLRTQWVIYDLFGGVAYSGGGEVEIELP